MAEITKEQVEELVGEACVARDAFSEKLLGLGRAGIMTSMASVNMTFEEDNLTAHVSTPVEIALHSIEDEINSGVFPSSDELKEFTKKCALPSCKMFALAFELLGKRYAEICDKIQAALPEEEETAEDSEDAVVESGVERIPTQEAGNSSD